MGGRGGSMGGSHGMGGGGSAGGAAKTAAPAAPQTREQQLLAQIKGNPAALMQMSDQDALDTVKAIEQQSVATDGTERDCWTQRYLNLLGWNSTKPQVLDEKAYEAARKNAKTESMYHAVKDSPKANAAVLQQQYLTGATAYTSEGYYGAGTYWAHGSAVGSSMYGNRQIKCFLNKRAKVISTGELDNMMGQFARSKPNTFAHLLGVSSGYGTRDETLYTLLAASHGYNTIVKGRSRKITRGDYVITLDRSTTTVASTIKNCNSITNNW